MKMQNMKANETTEQIKLFNWAKHNQAFIPELGLMFHVPNEGKRTRTSASILKAAGLRSGIPDICLPVSRRGYHALYIELKFRDGRTSKEQKEMIGRLQAEGNAVYVCYGFEEAREVIRHYLARAEGFDLVNCEEALKVFDKCDGFQDWESVPCRHCSYYAHSETGGKSGRQDVGRTE